MSQRNSRRRALTLIELLIAIAIIAILISLLVVGVQKVRDAEKQLGIYRRFVQCAPPVVP